MSNLIVTAPTRPRAVRDRDTSQRADLDRERPSRLWALIEALAYAGAMVDPSGIMAVQRLRWAKEEEQGNRRR